MTEQQAANLIEEGPGSRPARRDGFEASPAIGKLAGALAKAQGAFDAIGKTREVTVRPKDPSKPSYKFMYAPLDEVMRAVRPGLSANGLALTQFLADASDGRRVMTTTLMHESGEWMASTTTLPGVATSAQEFGSQVTYMRRYAIVSILGVVAEEDDDGNHADGNHVEGRDRAPKGRTAGKASSPPSANGSTVTSASANGSGDSSEKPSTPVTDEAMARALRLSKLLTTAAPDGCGWTKPHCQKWGKKRFGVEDPTQLTEEQYKDATLLALAYMQGGDTGYKAKLAELVAAGRVMGDEKEKAA